MSGFEKRCYTNVHWVGKFVHTRCVREIYCTYTSGALLVGKENWLKRKRDHAHRGGGGSAVRRVEDNMFRRGALCDGAVWSSGTGRCVIFPAFFKTN